MAKTSRLHHSGAAVERHGRILAKRLAFVADDLVSNSSGVVILAYHRVGGTTPSPVDLPEAHFRRQMDHVAATAVTLDDALSVLTAKTNTDSDPAPVVVSFDDGTRDFSQIALPILVELNIPAVLYLATSPVDSRVNYPNEGQPISWNELRDCVSTGLVTIGAHTHDHVLLDRCSPTEALDQLTRCNERIEDELGVSPQHFAYPKAVAPSNEIDGLVRARYVSAAVAGTRPNTAASDVHRLTRSPIQNADGWDGFVRKVDGGMRLEDDIRRVVNLVRYRTKTS